MEATFSWEYVAGFFDGEGTVSVSLDRGWPSIRVILAQSGEPGLAMLTALSNWLATKDVHSKVYAPSPRRRFVNELPAYRLQIHRVASVLEFLLNVRPFVHIKAEQIDKNLAKHVGLRGTKEIKEKQRCSY